MFFAGAWFFMNTVGHVQGRIDAWRDPFDPELYDAQVSGSYQIAQSPLRAGRRRAVRDRLRPGAAQPADGPADPARRRDRPHLRADHERARAVRRRRACIAVYLLFAERGFKTAMLAQDSFSKLLAAGLAAVFALQVFVIVGGVTKLIPLTGVTMPFVSYGGSSIVANFILLALLLTVSNRARAPR